MPVLRRENVDLHYERTGEGPPLLLIAGLFSDVASWRPIRAPLEARYDVIAFDNRCAGRSIPKPCIADRESMIGDCLALLDHLGIERAHVLGHSLGGMIGLHLAQRNPERVASLVAAAACPSVTQGQIALFSDMAALYCAGCVPRQQWFRLLFQWLYSPAFFHNETAVTAALMQAESYEYAQSNEALRAQVAALRDFTSPPALDRIEVPVLALTAINDLLAPPDDVSAALKALPHLQEVILPDAAHALHWEAPAAFVEAVVRFHESIAARG
ncbi:MAG TPA: alpha/beta fold hydrolase [Pararhizobium sp.]|nr:alpha/beta fold hydrolase [Pararhizobium sp.]